MMHPNMAAQHQPPYQNQFPQQQQQHQQQQQQQQSINQQRPPINGQQAAQIPGQQKAPFGQQQTQNPFANYNPQLALFTLEKHKDASSWEDVEPEQQRFALQDLQHELSKFRRKQGSVKRVLNEIPSTNCRRIINELVERQNHELWKYNKTIHYKIASVEIEWRSVNRRERQLRRVHVMLETEPSGYQEPIQNKGAVGGAGNAQLGQQDPNKAMKQNPPPMQNQQFPPQPNNIGQLPRFNPQQQTNFQNVEPPPMRVPPGHGQGQGQGHGHDPAHIPAPPPPPHGAPMMGQPGMAVPLPAVPGIGGHGVPAMHGALNGMQPGHSQNFPPQGRQMPGSFPEQIPMQGVGMRGGQVPTYETMDAEFLRGQKSKHKDRRGTSSESGSWTTDSDDSNSDPIVVLPGDYDRRDRRERGRSRQSTKSRKSRRSRSRSAARSQSHSLTHRTVEPFPHKSSRRRRDSFIEPPPIGKYSPSSSKANSPRSSRAEMPPIHVHVNTNNNIDELRDRRASLTPSPMDLYKDKMNLSQPMSRDNSWDRGSGTASFATSSAYSAEDPVFDAPMRRPSVSHVNSRTQSYSRAQPPIHHHPHPSHIYDDVDRRPNIRYPADDYPHNQRLRDSYHEEPSFGARPGMPRRRNSVQVTSGNPFTSSYFPPKPIRSMSYAADMHEPGYAFPTKRLTDREHDDQVDLKDLADALKHIKDSRRVPLNRRGSERGNAALFSEDEWYPSARGHGY